MSSLPVAHDVSDDEVLARFILHKRYVRSDGTLKPDSFIPHPYPDLSVTRHIGLEELSIWAIGEAIAVQQSKSLYGRGMFQRLFFAQLT